MGLKVRNYSLKPPNFTIVSFLDFLQLLCVILLDRSNALLKASIEVLHDFLMLLFQPFNLVCVLFPEDVDRCLGVRREAPFKRCQSFLVISLKFVDLTAVATLHLRCCLSMFTL